MCPRAPGYENFKWTNYGTTLKSLDIDGLYMDGSCNPYFCTDDYPCHCAMKNRAGTAEVGRYNIFAIRERMKTIRRTFDPWKPGFLVIAHCEMIPMYTISFADVAITGENLGLYYDVLGDPLPEGFVRSRFTGTQYGIEVALYADGWNCESAQALPFLTMLGSTDEWIFNQKSLPVAWSALNHFNLANSTFVPFWQNPLVNALPKGVKASVYVHNGRDALIMLTNYSSSRTPAVSISIDPQKLMGKATLSQRKAVDYVRALAEYPIMNNTFSVGSLGPFRMDDGVCAMTSRERARGRAHLSGMER